MLYTFSDLYLEDEVLKEVTQRLEHTAYLKKLKMGNVFYLVTKYFSLDGLGFEVRKVMVMNFPSFDSPIVSLKLGDISTKKEPFGYTIYLASVPTKGQRKDAILVGNGVAFCTDKKAAHDFIKRELTSLMTSKIIFKSMEKRTTFIDDLLLTDKLFMSYRQAINKLKQL